MKNKKGKIIQFSSKDINQSSLATREHLQTLEVNNLGGESITFYSNQPFNKKIIDQCNAIILHEVRSIKRVPKLILIKILFFKENKKFPKIIYDSHDLNKLNRTIYNASINKKSKSHAYLQFLLRYIAEFILYYFSDLSFHVSKGHQTEQASLYKLLSKKIINKSYLYYLVQNISHISSDEERIFKEKFKGINKYNFNKKINSLTYLGTITKRRIDCSDILLIREKFKIDIFYFYGPSTNFCDWLNYSKKTNQKFSNLVESKSLIIIDKGPFDSRDLRNMLKRIDCTFIPSFAKGNEQETKSVLNNKMFISLSLKVPILYHRTYKSFYEIFAKYSLPIEDTEYLLIFPSIEVEKKLISLRKHNQEIIASLIY